MDLAMEPAKEGIKAILQWAVNRWGYAYNLPSHAQTLDHTLKSLIPLRADAAREVDRAQRQGKLPRNEVLGWMGEADEVTAQGLTYVKKYHDRGKSCRMVKPSRYRLGKRMVEMSTTIVELRGRGKFGEADFSVPVLPEPVGRVPGGDIRILDTPLEPVVIPGVMGDESDDENVPLVAPSSASASASTSQAYQAGPSTSTSHKKSSVAEILEQIWQWLLDPHILRIGIWGKGGIGKTTIMKNIINFKLYKTTHFDVVILVVVSRDWNMKKLRQSIAKELQLDISEEEENRAAHLLYSELRRRKFFLIFDDTWEKIDLDALGVPAPSKTNGCKIAVTTRKRVVCRHMETDKEILMNDLPENEAWELFREKAGDVISPSIESIAKFVCKECHGLPLALIVVGRALRMEKDKREWEHALKVLRSSRFELEGMEIEVFSPLKFSYDYLKSDMLKDCFLYCALFPEDYAINTNHLISYWVTEGLIDEHEGFVNNLDRGRHYVLKELLDSCLLERRSHWDETIHMHDVIRDMAIKITSSGNKTERGRRFLVHAGKGLDEWIGGNDLKEVDKISLMENNIETLADAPDCPRLSTILLMGNDPLESIPENFFRSMIALRVLDLSAIKIKSLPQSISGLVNLQALILRECFYLKDITHIGSLSSLLLLDLSHTKIVELPDEVCELKCLRSLNLSYTFKLERISAGTISKLSNLEFLEMKESAYFGGGASKEGTIQDIGCLRHLQHLSLDITSGHNATCLCLIFPKFKELVSFVIRLGPTDPTVGTVYSKENAKGGLSKRSGRCLELVDISQFSHRIFEIARYTDKLFLANINSLDRVSSLGVRNLENTKELWVSGCKSISKAIIDQEKEILFPNLEVLVLYETLTLPCVWEDKGASGIFGSLKIIDLHKCISASYVFSIDVISELRCLEELKISDCHKMTQIVIGVKNEGKTFPKLTYFELAELSKLKALWEQKLFLPALREIRILNCTALNSLPLARKTAPMLHSIEGQAEWWNYLRWPNGATRSYFHSFFKPSQSDVYYKWIDA